jgi:cation:H+ antiporter
MNDYLLLLAGVVCAGLGGELFLRGLVGIATWARVSASIIGATVAAFATSSPELFVGISAAMAGKPQISFGDVLGSNVANVGLILGLALLISGIQTSRDTVRRDFPVALLAPAVLGFLSLDGLLSRFDGLILLGLFLAWMLTVVAEARKQREQNINLPAANQGWGMIVLCVIGFTLLAVGGRLVVGGARGIAVSFGISAFVIGATVVAVGTSVPELAATVISQLRGHNEVGLGTILGSNIFNGLAIVGIVALISPIAVDRHEAVTALAAGLATVALTWPPRNGFIRRRRGLFLITVYVVYVVTVLR